MIFKIRDGQFLKHVPITVRKEGETLYLYFEYDTSVIDEVRAMDHARWNKELRCWTIKDNERNQYALACLQEDCQLFTRYIRQRQHGIPLFRDLMQHQIQGCDFILTRRRCLLAYEMGLGKTLLTIEAVEYVIRHEQKYNWWLIAPFGAQQEWKRQLERWNAKFIFTVVSTYESLYKWMDALPDNLVPDGIIFDESIKIKNPAAQRSQVAGELARMVRARDGYIVLLSGAPAPKNPVDWWHQIEVLQPGFIRESNVSKFTQRYANVREVDYGYGPHKEVESWREEELVKLGKRLSSIVSVRKKKDCLDLPDKIYDEIQCAVSEELMKQAVVVVEMATSGIEALEKLRELSDGFQYNYSGNDGTIESNDKSTYGDTRPEVADDQSVEHRVSGIEEEDAETRIEYRCDSEKITRGSLGSNQNNNNDVKPVTNSSTGNIPQTKETGTRQAIYASVNPKLDKIKELLSFYSIEEGGPGRLVIYAWYQASIDLLMEFCFKHGWNTARIDGRGWSNKDILVEFESEEPKNIVIIANPGSVHGITLSKTLALVYYSNSFLPDHRVQSIERRDRPGMDTTKGTRIVDLLCLPSDKRILDSLKAGINLQNITLSEIKKCMNV